MIRTVQECHDLSAGAAVVGSELPGRIAVAVGVAGGDPDLHCPQYRFVVIIRRLHVGECWDAPRIHCGRTVRAASE